MHDHNLNQQSLELAREILLDKKRQRRFSLLSKLLWVLLIGVVIFSALPQEELQTDQDHLAVIDLKGPIFADTPAGSSAFIQQLNRAFKSTSAKIILVDANSPGGAPAQASIINDAIIRLKAKYNKPIYTVVSDMCASACYYALANTDKIYTNNVSLLGSIGVRLESYDIQGLAEKIGVKQRLFTAGEHKAFLNPFTPVDPVAKAHLQNMLNETHAAFINTVKQGRGDKLSPNKDLFSGLIWNGNRSIELGLADALGDLHAIAATEFNGLTLHYYAPKESWLEELSRFSVKALSSVSLSPFGLLH